MSLSLFHKFVEIRVCGLQRTADVVFWLKLVSVPGFKNSYIVEKQLHNGMMLEKKSFCCLPTQIREVWFRCLDIHSKLSQTLQLSTLQLNQLFSNAIYFTKNLQLWHLKTASHPVKCVWCNCEKGCIYPSWRDVGRRARKFDKSRANQFLSLLQMPLMLKRQIFFNFQFDGCTTVSYFWTTMSRTHLKVFYLFRDWSCLVDSNVWKIT